MDFLCVFMTRALVCLGANVWLSSITDFSCMDKAKRHLPLVFCLSFCLILSILFTLWFHSASSDLSPTTILFPLPFLTLLHSLPLPFIPLHTFFLNLSLTQYQSPSMSLCLELIWELFPDHPTSSFSPSSFYVIISQRTRLNSYMWNKEKVQWSRAGGKKRKRGRLGGCCSRGLRENGFSYSMFIGSCRLQSTSWCITQVSLHSAIFALPIFSPFSNLFFVCFDLSSSLLSPHPPPPLFIHLFPIYAYFFWSPTFFTIFTRLLVFPSLPLWSSSEALQSNPLMGVLKVRREVPLSILWISFVNLFFSMRPIS